VLSGESAQRTVYEGRDEDPGKYFQSPKPIDRVLMAAVVPKRDIQAPKRPGNQHRDDDAQRRALNNVGAAYTHEDERGERHRIQDSGDRGEGTFGFHHTILHRTILHIHSVMSMCRHLFMCLSTSTAKAMKSA
jgi:hypothetical protein